MNPVWRNPWVRAAGVILALLLLALLVYLLSPVLVSLFFAFIIAYIFDPVADWFEGRGISRSLAIAFIATILIAVVAAIPLWLVPWIIVEAEDLNQIAKARYEERDETDTGVLNWFDERLRVEDRLRWFVETMGWHEEAVPGRGAGAPGVEAIEPVEPETESPQPAETPPPSDVETTEAARATGEAGVYDPMAVIVARISGIIREQGVELVRSHGRELAGLGQTAGLTLLQILHRVGEWIMNAILVVANIALFGFVSVYLLKDYDHIVWHAKQLTPPRYQNKVFDIAHKIDLNLRSFLRGQAMVCLCLGILYAIGLSIAGVPFAILIAAFGAIASFVPYLGLILTIGPAVILCVWWHEGIDWHLAVTIGTFVAAQVLEGTVITPKIVGDQVGLGPVWVILAVLVFGSALGFLGLLLAVPIAAVLKVFIMEALEAYRRSKTFGPPPPTEA